MSVAIGAGYGPISWQMLRIFSLALMMLIRPRL